MRLFDENRSTNNGKKNLFSTRRHLNFELLEERRFLSATPWNPDPEPAPLENTAVNPEPIDNLRQAVYAANGINYDPDPVALTATQFMEAIENGARTLDERDPNLGTIEFERNTITLTPPSESGLGDWRFVIRFGDELADIFTSFTLENPNENNLGNGGENEVFQIFGGLLELAAAHHGKPNPENGDAGFASYEGTNPLEFRLRLEDPDGDQFVEYEGTYEDEETIVFDIQDVELESESTFQVALMARVLVAEEPTETETGGSSSPSSPSDFRMISASGSMAGFSWNSVPGVTLDNYFIYLSKAEKGVFKNVSLGTVDEEGSVSIEIGKGKDGRIFVYFFGIEPGETYYFFVRANHDEDNWADSSVFGFKTKIPTIK